MSLYGALFGGVSGLSAQSSKMGIISDNIANVNTVGYKQGAATFESLVVNANGNVSYQTGGVRGGTVQQISKQGLLQSTESPTDLAISGGGFFVVKAVADKATSSTPLYTRAGSFTQDSLGNFINSAGYYLQGWPLDREGRLPGEPGNLDTTSFTNFDSLETINVQSASGVAQATSTISLGANLKSSETVFPGQAGVFSLDSTNLNNLNQAATAILAGSEYGLAPADSVTRGDAFQITAGGQQFTYTYGGYTVGRNVTNGSTATNYGDTGFDNKALKNLDASTAFAYTGVGTNTLQVTIPNNGLITGDTVTFAGINANIGATTPAELNAPHIITRIDDNTFTITLATDPGQAVGTPIAADPFTADTRVFQGNILDATSTTGNFLSLTGSSGFTSDALAFTITQPSGVSTFRYVTSSPNTLNGEFNSLSTLASAINSVNGLTARVVNGRIIIGGENANDAITFANGDAVGGNGQRGIDWINELDVAPVPTGNRVFSSIQGLADLVNADEGVSATVDNPLSNPKLNLLVDDPQATIQFKDLGVGMTIPTGGTSISFPDATYAAGSTIPVSIDLGTVNSGITTSSLVNITGLTAGLGGLPGGFPNGGPYKVTAVSGSVITIDYTTPQDITTSGTPYAATVGNTLTVVNASNHGSLLGHLGLAAPAVASLLGSAYTAPQDSGPLGPQYDPTGNVGHNMASGEITAQFSRNVRIYDGLGTGHDVRFSYIKTATNTWAVEVHAIPASDIKSIAPLVDGQIATGSIVFNGDGTLNSVSSSLTSAVAINWNNGSISSGITLNFGTAGQPFGTVGATTIGQSDGLSQFDSAYNVNFANQNGAPVGQLESVAINSQGEVIASYSNGETQALYKLPLASFANPDGLLSTTGNVYAQTRESGEVNLREAGTNGTGTVVSAALEQSNVDLATQLTDMIVAQRAYQANTKVIKTADDLLQELNQI